MDWSKPPEFPKPAIIRPGILRPTLDDMLMLGLVPGMTGAVARASEAAAAGAWTNVAGPLTGDGNNADWNGYTLRQTITNAAMTFPAATSFLRVTFEAAAGQGLTISAAYVQNAAAAGDVYDFDSAPLQLLFDSGSASKAISAGAQAVSDPVAFTRIAGRGLVVSYYVGGGAGVDDVRSKATQTGWVAYWKLANDPATVDATGYSPSGAGVVLGVMRVEAFG